MQGLWATVEDSGFYFQCLAKLLGFHKILLAVGMRIGRESGKKLVQCLGVHLGQDPCWDWASRGTTM